MGEPEQAPHELPGSAAPAYRFLIWLRDDDDSTGLAHLLTDVLLPEAESQASFKALGGNADELGDRTAHVGELAPGGRGPRPVFVLEDDDAITDLIRTLPAVLLGVSDTASADRYSGLRGVTTFPASGPLDFAAEVMEQFSRADAPAQLFDPDEAARMRALASDFPVDYGGEPAVAEDLVAEAEEHWRQGELDQALAAFDSALEDDPDQPELHLWRAYVLHEVAMRQQADGSDPGDSEEQAREAFRRALTLGYPVADEIGDALFDLGDYSGAADAYRAALRREETARLHTSLGTAMARDDHLDDRFRLAHDEYTLALGLDPDNVVALRSRSVVRLRLCDYEAALLDSRAAAEHGADDARLYFYRAFCLLALGDLAEARSSALRARDTATEADGIPPYEYEHICALVMTGLGELDEALSALETAEQLARDADDYNVLASMKASRGLVLARLGKFDEGRAFCEGSLALNAEAPEAYATLAWIAQRQERLVDARAAIERAIDLIESSSSWQRDCQYRDTRWRFYLMKAAILNAAAERYDDREAAEAALEATSDGQANCDQDLAKRKEESIAQLFLERARAHALCQRHDLAAVALRECIRAAPERSSVWYGATRSLRYAPGRSLEIKPRWIVVVELLAVAGIVALFLRRDLSSAAFAALIISVPALGLAAFSLPVITEFRIGAVQLQKTVATASTTPFPQLEPAAPPAQLPPARLAVNSRTASHYFPSSSSS